MNHGITALSGHRAHRDQRGAVALMSLASILIIVMLSMVLLDLAELGVEKTHLQNTTDASAYSQATIQARSMNMMAFANSGKRMTVGMANTYVSLYQWLHNLEHLVWYSDYDNNSWLTESDNDGICDPSNPIAQSMSGPNLAEYCDLLTDVERTEVLDIRRSEGLVMGDQLGDSASPFGEFSPEYEPSVEDTNPRGAIFNKPARKTIHTDTSGNPHDYHSVLEWGVHVSDRQEYTKPIHDSPEVCVKGGGVLGTGSDGSTRIDPYCFEDDANHGIRLSWQPGDLVGEFYGRDLVAYDNYQRYLASMAPYWAWTEGVMRGLANAAPVTIGYPMPDFPNMNNQEYMLELPVERGEFNETCQRVRTGVNSPLGRDVERQAGVESVLANSLSSFGTGSDEEMALALIAYGAMEFDDLDDGTDPSHQILPRDWYTMCSDATGELFAMADGGGVVGVGGEAISDFRRFGQPFMVNNYADDNEHRWLMDASNLMIGFRPNASRFDLGREKFFVAGEPVYDHSGAEAGGMWSMARAEMAFQMSDTPDAWSPVWSARLRPVALPEEWSEYEQDPDFAASSGFEFHTAIEEMVRHTDGQAFEHITNQAVKLDDDDDNHLMIHNHGSSLNTAAGDYLDQEWDAIEAMVKALGTPTGVDVSRMEGVAK